MQIPRRDFQTNVSERLDDKQIGASAIRYSGAPWVRPSQRGTHSAPRGVRAVIESPVPENQNPPRFICRSQSRAVQSR